MKTLFIKTFSIMLIVLLLGNISIMAQEKQYKVVPTKQTLAQMDSFKIVYPKSQIKMDDLTGKPGEISVFISKSYSGPTLNKAQSFLKENTRLFGMKKDLSDLKFIDSDKTTIEGKTGIEYVRFQQTYNELPVIGTEVLIHMTETGKIFRIQNSYYPDITIENKKTLKKEEVIAMVRKKVKKDEKIPVEDLADLIVFPKEGKFYYAWQVQVGDWRYYINADNGDVITYYSTVLEQRTCTGNVYQENICKTPTIISGSLPNLDDSGYLEGTNFDIQTFSGTRAQSTNCSFNFSTGNDRFDQVMIYYQLERIRTYLNNLGYASNPAQTTAYANVSSLSCNASYNWAYNYFKFGTAYESSCDGLMCYSPGQDGNVIMHEFGHQVVHQEANFDYSSITNANLHHTLAIHEAVADYFTGSFYNDPCISEGIDANCSTCLRNIDNNNTFPTNVHASDPHITSLILSAALWDIREQLGTETADWLIYESLKGLPNDPDFRDFAHSSLDIMVAKIDEIDEWWAKLILILGTVAIRDCYCEHGIVPADPYACD